MKKIVFILALLLAAPTYTMAADSDTKDAKELTKEQKKAEKEAEKARKKAEKEARKAAENREDSLRFEVVKQSVNDMRFVVVADRVRDKTGRTINVNSTTNFVLVQGDEATVQLAFEGAFSGPNGLGGITLNGKISNVKCEIDKRGNLVFSMMVNGTGISADVSFTIPKNSNRCDATVDSNFHSTRITFSGELKPYSSKVFKGREI